MPSSHTQTEKASGITLAQGYTAGATYCGLKRKKGSLDLGMLYSQRPASTAGVFTTNKVKAAPIVLSHENLVHTKGRARAVVVNSGSANASVGKQGIKDAREMAELAAERLHLDPEEIMVASTGVIGVELPMGLIRAGIKNIEMSPTGGLSFARSIITTDLRTKEFTASGTVNKKKFIVGGCAKGSGMIHPNMATMLSFITTDAEVDPGFLDKCLRKAVDRSFNMITVDGDTSTNDSVFVFANGASGVKIEPNTPAADAFERALSDVCTNLAIEIARDGEGAQKLITVRVESAHTQEEARLAARAIASSNLVKTAVRGNDPNWGRVLAALGRSGASIDERKITMHINAICTMDGGMPVPFYKEAAVAAMSEPEVVIRVQIGIGKYDATAWGCDLTEEYVRINSSYTT